ncbi:peptidoglycan-binding protein [Oscillochloris sp. ZM17-4]|uniref:peptidoglycan-binding protein n=1 Tax=Oscillochloris sp. ZM17-4 TaxID=2866714 RepID=UPI001C72E8C6|nr:peptidoglycan-binding protein [Oscillochloris sp. ZM17-4]MBX0326405.1 peptidoglycan-binding protein [Oscillochloris sp. ZM17-4]
MSLSEHIRRSAAPAALLLLTLALAACGGVAPPSAQAPTAPPTEATATAAPATDQPTATPTPFPTATPAPAAPPTPTPIAQLPALPAAVYVTAADGGQIMRVERDGGTVAQITFEQQPVVDYDVASNGGEIAYIYGDDSLRTLVALDGGGRRELISGQLSTPRVSPDGRTVAVRIDDAAPELGATAGVWAVSLETGQASLLIADDDIEGQEPPDGTAWAYTPVAYDGAGQRLLLWAYNMAGPAIPGGELVIISAGGDAPTRSEPTCCEGEAWSVDGSAVTVVGGGPGPDIAYGLNQIDAETGAQRALIAQTGSDVPLVTGARQMRDGDVYALYELAPGDIFSWDYPFTPQMVRVSPDGAITPLRQDSYQVGEVLWRDDASGAMITSSDSAGGGSAGRLIWLDSGGGPAVPTNIFGAQLRWADSAQPLYAGDCALLPQVGWQPPDSRVFSAGAADLQARLGAQGFAAGAPDGYFGDQTRAALRAFQASRSLPTGDALDCATWQALLGRP